MGQQEEETLKLLGLSPLQTRVYMALVASGRSSVGSLSKSTDIARSDVYRTMLALQKLGLVKKIFVSPTMFESLPVEYTLPYLFDSKVKATQELGEKTCNLINVLNNRKQCRIETDDLVLIPASKILLRKKLQLIENTNESIDVVKNCEGYKFVLTELFDNVMTAIQRGVKMRVVFQYSKKIKFLPEHKALLSLFKANGSSLRYIEDQPLAVVSIFDHKNVLMPLSSYGYPCQSPVLLSNNASLVNMAEVFFESIWKKAKDI